MNGRLIPIAIINASIGAGIGAGLVGGFLAGLAAAGVTIFILGGMFFIYEIATAPTIDEVFPPEDRLPASGPEARPMPGESHNITELNATATHEGEK